jgi:HNH endonuclease
MSESILAALRALVRVRSGHCCEYCLLHEDDAGLPHEPDHVVALKHRGETTAENLAWTCFNCNRHKGTDLASIDSETGRIVRLFHPRKDKWVRHFRLEGALIIPESGVGRVTEFLLQLNHPDRLEIREVLFQQGCYPR